MRATHDRLLERGTDRASGRQIGPSLTPLTNLNSGFRVYEVDSGVRILSSLRRLSALFDILPQTFEILDAHT